MRKFKTAYENIIEREGNELANVAKLLSGNREQARDTLEQIIDHALKQLYASAE